MMKSKITVKLDLTKDAGKPTAIVLMYKTTEDDIPLRRFALLSDGIWKEAPQNKMIPAEAKLPVIIEGE